MKTQTAAQTRKAELEAKYTNRTFRIIDNGREMKVGKAMAEMDGAEIVEDLGRFVIAKYASFDIVEVIICKCGAEILTADIGKVGLNECADCTEARKNRFENRMAQSAKREQAKVDFAVNMY